MIISFNDMLIFLAIFIGVFLGIAVLVLLVVALVRLIKTITKVNKILDDNSESIGKIVKKLPELTENFDKAVTGVGEKLMAVNGGFFDTRSANDTVGTVISIVESVASLAGNFFSKKK